MSVKAHPGTANTIGQVIVNELGVGVVLGTTATTAAAGNHTHSASNVGALSSSTTSSQSGYFTNINLLDSTSSLYYLKMGYSDSTLTATRLLTFSVENADRHLTIRSNAIIAHDTHENSIAGHTWFTKSAIEGLLTGIITSHTHADATISTDGFMSAEDKTKLDSLNNYTHPTTDGYLHVPATGTSNNNKVLKAGATAGSLSWGSIDWSELTNVPTSFTPSAHTHDDLYMALGVTIDGGTW
jgi:hypothetical protein